MATIIAYTTIEQSRKLAKFLPLESADMYWYLATKGNPVAGFNEGYNKYGDFELPCWSLSALLSVLPFHIIANNQGYAFSMHKGLNKDGETYMVRYNVFNTDVCLYKTEYYNNPIDACYEMIIKLHELKKL